MAKNKFYTNIKNAFNKAAGTYNKNAVLQYEVGQRLIERLDFFSIEPQTILDLGMGTGAVTTLVQSKYPDAHIVGLDFAENMLREFKARSDHNNNSQNVTLLCADINKIPLADKSIDLIFSNFTMQWCESITSLFKECHRVLKTNGILIFTVPGPETLVELRYALDNIDPEHSHVNNFIDMHDLGDILVQTKFAHPVMDNDHFTLTYSSVQNLLKDIKAVGANTKLTTNSRKTLFSKGKLQQLNAEFEKYKQADGKFPLTYEVVYGHAFKLTKPPKVKHPELSEISVPIEKIIRKDFD